MPKPWEKLDESRETGLRHEQFKVYLMMPRHERSVVGAWKKWHEMTNEPLPPSGEPGGQFYTITQQLRWEERALAYDRAEDKKLFDQLQARKLKSLLEVADLGETLRKKAATAARMLTAVTQSVGMHEGREVMIMAVTLTPDQIVRMADVGTKIEQLALGNPTELTGFVEAPTAASTENARALLEKKIEDIRARQAEAKRDEDVADVVPSQGRVVGQIGA
jgi:hypothetical protein